MIKFNNAVLRVLLISVLASGVVEFANAGGGVKIRPVDNRSKAIVTFSNFDSKEVFFSIENDAQSVVFYSEFVRNTSDFTKVFDFSLLKDGNYVLVVKVNNDVILEPILIENSSISVKQSKKVSEPVFKQKDKSLLVFYKSPEEGMANVKFLDKNDDVIFDETIANESLTRKYDISKLPVGSYKVALIDNDEYYNYNFEVK
jgi:hypothetical protein